MKKVIARAKSKIADNRNVLSDLDAKKISNRFFYAMETLYAMFTDGYSASSGELHLRKEIAEKAIRICSMLLNSSLVPEEQKNDLNALISLMLFQFARFDARIGSNGTVVRLQEQNRNLWNKELIAAGMHALEASMKTSHVSAYQIEARIASEHSRRISFDTTYWNKIISLYDQLVQSKGTEEVRLNRIAALRYGNKLGIALQEIEEMSQHTYMNDKPPHILFLYYSVKADLLHASGRHSESIQEWKRALAIAPTTADKIFIEQALSEV